MATRKNGSGNLESAMQLLIKNQALFVNQMATFATKSDERATKSDERFARIEKVLDLIKGLVIKHEDTLEKLPEAIRKKIGFKAS